MDITPIIPADRQVIDTYGPGMFRVSNIVWQGPTLVFPDLTLSWDVADLSGLTADSFAPVTDRKPEILLLGTGAKMHLVPSALRKAVREAGVVMDVMDTGAACRTYNVLLAEGRNLAAALFPV